MKALSIVGTLAMFLVGGGIVVHGIAPLHHAIEHFAGQQSAVVAMICTDCFKSGSWIYHRRHRGAGSESK